MTSRWSNDLYTTIAATCVLLACVLLVANEIHPASSSTWVAPHTKRTDAFEDHVYPRTLPVGDLPFVRLAHEDGVHYDMDSEIAIAEWNATLPSGGVLVHLGPDLRPFTVSMFHELRCLNIIREVLAEFLADDSPTAEAKQPVLIKHCMNYLRQMILCRADTRLESVRGDTGGGLTVNDVTHTCRDWTEVYRAAESNYAEYLSRRN